MIAKRDIADGINRIGETMNKKLPVLLLVLAILAGACTTSQVDQGFQFKPETLGLTPGSTTAELCLNWYGRGNVSLVRFFDRKGTLVTTAQGSVSPASKGKMAHKVTVEGLDPDTQYRYSVSNDGQNWSNEYTYRTAKTDRTTFAYVGDPQLSIGEQDGTSRLFSADRSTAQGWKDTMIKIAAAKVDFIAGVGDQVDSNIPNETEADYRNFFAPPELRNIPFAPAVGNHDRRLPFIYHFNLPNEQKFDPIETDDPETVTVEAAANYWYLYNDILFVVLNTSAYPGSAAGAMPYIDRFDKTISAAINANKGKYSWLFVQHHKSTASVAEHAADADVQFYIEAGFENLMDKYNVDFVLAGHDYVYARSFVMRDGKPVSADREKLTSPAGTVYLTANTASGLKYYNMMNEKDLPSYACVAIQNRKPEYTIIDVTGKTISFNTYDIDSKKPIDTFTVTK